MSRCFVFCVNGSNRSLISVQITVGTPSRARTVAGFLDKAPKPFELSSERGFLTITGRFKNVPISIVSIGMGSPNMDFFVREMRESVNGDMAIIRLAFRIRSLIFQEAHQCILDWDRAVGWKISFQ